MVKIVDVPVRFHRKINKVKGRSHGFQARSETDFAATALIRIK